MKNTEDTPYQGNNPVHWNRDIGSETYSNLSGGAADMTLGATVFGLGNTTGLVTSRYNPENGNYENVYNKRAMATTCLPAMAGAASGVSAFSQTAGPYGAMTGAALGVIGTAITGGLAAWDTNKTIARLKEIKANIPCWGADGSTDDLLAVDEVINFCLKKMDTKRSKSIATALVVGQPLVPLYKTGRALQKLWANDKGRQRAVNANDLVAISKKDGRAGQLARDVIAALLAKNFEQVMVDTVADAMKSG